MHGRFPSIQLFKFPRMSPHDTEIWRKFLIHHHNEYLTFDYDLPVGSGVDPGPSVGENFRKDFIDLTRKRIDAVGYNSKGVTLFEVKPRAGTTALGQLLVYRQLYVQTKPTVDNITMAVVTEFMNDEEAIIYKSNGIQIYIFQRLDT